MPSAKKTKARPRKKYGKNRKGKAS